MKREGDFEKGREGREETEWSVSFPVYLVAWVKELRGEGIIT